jgi:cell division protein ZapA
MKKEKKKVSVTIDGNSYTLVTSESPERISTIGKYINEKLKEVYSSTNMIDTRNAAILTCINIANDYYQSLDESDNLRAQTAAYIKDGEIARNEIKQLKEEIERLKKNIKTAEENFDKIKRNKRS